MRKSRCPVEACSLLGLTGPSHGRVRVFYLLKCLLFVCLLRWGKRNIHTPRGMQPLSLYKPNAVAVSLCTPLLTLRAFCRMPMGKSWMGSVVSQRR